ncbi:MAG: hypothetical protein LQ343_006864 [Gyalolechia ehrenbergii]|nr:MAG: hypothetical protein LQ343_006864 [Gyalolechia ehrenbergii]
MSPRNIVTMMQWFQGDWEISSIGLTAVSAWDLSADSISDSKGTVNATYVILTHATGAQRELVWERSGDEHSSGRTIDASFTSKQGNAPFATRFGVLRSFMRVYYPSADGTMERHTATTESDWSRGWWQTTDSKPPDVAGRALVAIA